MGAPMGVAGPKGDPAGLADAARAGGDGVEVIIQTGRSFTHGAVPLSRASWASQSTSCSRSLAARQAASRPQMTPRSPSPIPVPNPPRTSPYWVRQRQMLHSSNVRTPFSLCFWRQRVDSDDSQTVDIQCQLPECFFHMADRAKLPMIRIYKATAARNLM